MNLPFFQNTVIYHYVRFSQKYRIYPDSKQIQKLDQAFGTSRFAYNKALEYKKSQYDIHKISVSSKKLSLDFLRKLRKENEWLKDTFSQIPQQSVRDLNTAYNRFFNKISNYPKFKNKYSKQSFRLPQSNNHIKCLWDEHKIVIPKMDPIKAVFDRKFKNKIIKSFTISKTVTNKYFVSVLFGEEPSPNKTNITNEIIGIDLGVKDFLTKNNGEKIQNPKYYSFYINKIKTLQKIKSKLKKGSNNYNKIKLRIAQTFEYIKNCRLDFLHKTSSKLINDNQVIFVEDLDVKNLQQKSNKIMNRMIGDSAWSTFVQILTYKSEFKGKYLIKVNPRNTSKMCSNCGEINKELKLSDRIWQCKHCEIKHDRDINAAKNIVALGQGLPEFKALISNQQNIFVDSKG